MHDESRTHLTDANLLQAIGRGDASSFRVLVDRHGAVAHRIALRMLGDRSDAEDVAQEALLRLWRLAEQAAGIASLVAWLQRVATNICLDRLRQRQRRAQAITDDTGHDNLADGGPLADELIDQAQRAGAAQRAIARLPDRQRAAIILTYYEGLANASAADMLEMNIKAFESLLVRARQSLRQELALALEEAGHVNH